MKIEFQRMREEHMDGVIDCVYQTWKDNPWVKAFKSEKDAKQAFWDRINHQGVLEKSIVCIDKDTEEVVGCVFNQDALQYLQNQQKWAFHKEFEVIEEFIQICAHRIFEYCDPQKCMWGYWMSSKLQKAKIPLALFCLINHLTSEQGYQFLIGFTNHPKTKGITEKFQATYLKPIELKDLKKAKFDQNITLYPQFGDFNLTRPMVNKFMSEHKSIKISVPKPKL